MMSQSTKTFDCGLFSFDYPNTFKTVPIENAPHMVLKLESNLYLFSASYWDYGLDSSISIWDDNIVEHYSDFSIGGGDVVGVSKVLIQTKKEKQRCLKILTNIKGNNKLKMVQYLMINKGYLFVFCFLSQGTYAKTSSTSYSDNFFKGLMFKNNNISSEQFQVMVMNRVKQLNSQCPFQTDDCTIYKNVLLSGKTIIIKVLVEDYCDALVDYEEFKNKMAENMSSALDKEFVHYIEKEGYSVLYTIYNETEKLKKTIRISGGDILKYYSNSKESKKVQRKSRQNSTLWI